jgi:hypothetical protein
MLMSHARLTNDYDFVAFHDDTPIPDYERRKIEQKSLQKEDRTELSDFYVVETDEEREKGAPDYSASELAEIRCRAFQILKRAPTIFAVKTGVLSDWFCVCIFTSLFY